MKKFLFLFSLSLISFTAMNCTAQVSGTKATVASPESNINFRLFQTQNMWTFLKLDTRNGIIQHVQFSTKGDQMQYDLNSLPLAFGEEAKPGRFFLYPTENIYNFILLDQIDGRVWQVQWNIDSDKRGLWRIY